ncbi:Phytanoyl-CoA dioxygenase (PhyH) [Seminavis robusta]|uniref:Phytanoyl-CoA dioxygenase (PhyH) n=1 Tax=Seminavis robusta TaxID=568900 RepID=A0A9N8DJD5_9STRA|nr:Phytanoyl-CoA dioxygenase (PhyH) [Seminavis robusta]|eukprot:Sro119_g058010.1 Phytanoyl-CoA dioxygenase (PhyH) (359) ;mRNA; f:39714-40790
MEPSSSLTNALFGKPSTTSSSSLFAARDTDVAPSAPQPSVVPTKRSSSTQDDGEDTPPQPPPRERVLTRRQVRSKAPIIHQQLTLVNDDKDPEDVFGQEISSVVKLCGLAVVQNAIDPSILDSLAHEADATRTKICQALKARELSWNDSSNNEKTVRFYELAVRCQGRMDVRYNNSDNKKEPFWKNHSLLNSIVSHLLYGGESQELQPQLVYAGWIFSFPDSKDQPWHQDGIPLFPSTETVIALPTYAINVFIPLDDATLETGPTEFVPFSHRQTPAQAMEHIEKSDNNDSDNNLVNPLPRRGDILIYDYRICHRGTANLDKKKVRTVLYLMYARPWFREHVNFGTERLFPTMEQQDS